MGRQGRLNWVAWFVGGLGWIAALVGNILANASAGLRWPAVITVYSGLGVIVVAMIIECVALGRARSKAARYAAMDGL